MAAQKKLFNRLFWLIDTIYSAGKITRDEIDRRWAVASCNDDKTSEYGKRNFYRHIDDIYDIFGIEIVCNRSTHEYSIASLDSSGDSAVLSWLIDSFAVSNIMNISGNLRSRIIFEQIPEGTRHLSTIVTAMKNGHQLYVTYHRFDRPEPHSFLLAPYCLKVFRQRWYMIGKPEDHPEESYPRVYSLDRIKVLQPTDTPYSLPKNFNAEEFFRNNFGIDRTLTKSEHIRFKVNAQAAPYIRSLSLHPTQVEEVCKRTYSIFTVDVAPTYDFIQELRKHGSDLEVLEPESLRNLFRQDIKKLVRMYKLNGLGEQVL